MRGNALLKSINALLCVAMEEVRIDAVHRAIKSAGSQRALAALLGVSSAAVGQWLRRRADGGRDVAAKQCVRIEGITGGAVTRRDLRPDDWKDIWPELAESETKQPPALAHQSPAAINSEALPTGQEVAHV